MPMSVADIIMRAAELRKPKFGVSVKLPSELEQAQTRHTEALAKQEEGKLLQIAQEKEKGEYMKAVRQASVDPTTGKVDYEFIKNSYLSRGWIADAEAVDSRLAGIKEEAGKADLETAKARSKEAENSGQAANAVLSRSIRPDGSLDEVALAKNFRQVADRAGWDKNLAMSDIPRFLKLEAIDAPARQFVYDKELKDLEGNSLKIAEEIKAKASKDVAAYESIARASANRYQEVAKRATQSSRAISILHDLSATVNMDGSVDTGKLAGLTTTLRAYAAELNIPIDNTKLNSGEYITMLHNQLALATAGADVTGPASDRDMQIVEYATAGLTTPKQVIDVVTKVTEAKLRVDTFMDTVFSKDIQATENMPAYAYASALDAALRNTPMVAYKDKKVITFWEYLERAGRAGVLQGKDVYERTQSAINMWKNAYHEGY